MVWYIECVDYFFIFSYIFFFDTLVHTMSVFFFFFCVMGFVEIMQVITGPRTFRKAGLFPQQVCNFV